MVGAVLVVALVRVFVVGVTRASAGRVEGAEHGFAMRGIEDARQSQSRLEDATPESQSVSQLCLPVALPGCLVKDEMNEKD